MGIVRLKIGERYLIARRVQNDIQQSRKGEVVQLLILLQLHVEMRVSVHYALRDLLDSAANLLHVAQIGLVG